MKWTPSIMLLGLTLIGPACADERHDGNWWHTLELKNVADSDVRAPMVRIVKLTYITGFADGMDLGHLFTVLGSPKDKASEREQAHDAGGRSYQYHQERHHIATITTEQLADGLDSFYADYRNRSILICNAIFVVSLKIAGDPDKEADTITENLRQSAQ
jgi:hypothetical protein